MPLNWLQSLQYADIPGSYGKGIVNRNNALQNQVLEEKLDITGQLSKAVAGEDGADGTDGSAQNALLQRLAVLDPQSAAAVLKVKDSMNPTPFSGEGFKNQLAGAQYRAYLKAGYSADEAALKAGTDVATMEQNVYTDEAGNTHVISSKPLPPVKAAGGSAPARPQIPDEERQMLKEFHEADPGERPIIYKQKLKEAADSGVDVSNMPEELTPELEEKLLQLYSPDETQMADAGDTTAEPVVLKNDNGVIDSSAVENSPKVKVARASENAKLMQKSVREWRDEAVGASEALDGFQRVYDIYNNGFKGGALAGFDMTKIVAKRTMGQPLSPEEQEFANNYSLLDSTAKVNVAAQIKPIFGGNISDGEREFAISLQAAPLDIQEQAIAKAAVQEAGSLQKIRKVEMLDEWEKQYGAPEAKDGQGRSFEKFYGQFVKENPILTSEFLSQRGAVVPVKSVKQAEELPVGTRFVAPDGKIRIRK